MSLSTIQDPNAPLLPYPVLLHVILMSLTCIVLMPASIYVANQRHTEPLPAIVDKYAQQIKQQLQLIDRRDLYVYNSTSKQRSDTWFHIHNTLTFVATLCMIGGWCCIFAYNADWSLSQHISDWHYIIGIITMLLLIFIQPKLGTATTQRDIQDRWKHRLLGYTLLCGTLYSLFSGWSLLFDKYLPV